MKKSKIVSALMALALTVSPLSGINGFKAITDSPVKVSAAGPVIGEPNSITVNSLQSYFYVTAGHTALNNLKGQELYLSNDGSLHILSKKVLFNAAAAYNPKTIRDPRTGVPIKKFKLAFQADGNLVVYNDTDEISPAINRALYHTNSYYGSAKSNKYLASQIPYYTYKKISPMNQSRFTLTDDGHLIIRCCYKVVTFSNKTEFKWATAWDSRYDSIDRVI